MQNRIVIAKALHEKEESTAQMQNLFQVADPWKT